MKQPTSHRIFRVGEIKSNPFRAIGRYSLREEKVEALRASISKTTFWDNIVARIRNGKPEIAYGHHRLEALHREFGEDGRVGLILRELDDAQMLKIMVQENMQEWDTSAAIEQESVRAVVLAYGDGTIQLPAPDPKTPLDRLRFAPSFTLGGDDPNAHLDHGRRRYTAPTTAQFLGWHEEKVRLVLQALALIELKLLTPTDFAGLSPTQARALVVAVRKADKDWGWENLKHRRALCDTRDPLDWEKLEQLDEEERVGGIKYDRRAIRTFTERAVKVLRDGKIGYRSLEQKIGFPTVKRTALIHIPTRSLYKIRAVNTKLGDLVIEYAAAVKWFTTTSEEFCQRVAELPEDRLHFVRKQIAKLHKALKPLA